jgi:hypothetical protein
MLPAKSVTLQEQRRGEILGVATFQLGPFAWNVTILTSLET